MLFSFNNICDVHYTSGIAGEVSITENGDRDAVYSLWDITDTENGVFEVGKFSIV